MNILHSQASPVETLGRKYVDFLARHHVARESLAEDRNQIAGQCYDARQEFEAALRKLREMCS